MSGQFFGTRLLGVLALAALPAVMAVGCDDDDDKKPDNVDAGDGDNGDGDGDKVDAGDGDGSDVDAGGDASVDEPLSCGEGDAKTTCEGAAISSIALNACCTEKADLLCGLDVSGLEEATNGLLAGCIARNQPSVPAGKKTSQTCTGFFENIDAPETDTTAINGYTLVVAGQTLSFEGCCRLTATGTGECGLAVDTILGFEVGFGCLPMDDFRGAFASDAQFQQAKALGVCDPTTGEAVVAGGDGDGDGGDGDGGDGDGEPT